MPSPPLPLIPQHIGLVSWFGVLQGGLRFVLPVTNLYTKRPNPPSLASSDLSPGEGGSWGHRVGPWFHIGGMGFCSVVACEHPVAKHESWLAWAALSARGSHATGTVRVARKACNRLRPAG